MRSLMIAGRTIKQIVKDKRTLALLFVAPLFIIFLLYSVLDAGDVKPSVDAVGLPSALVTALEKQAKVTVTAQKDRNAALGDLKAQKTDAVLIFKDGNLSAAVEGSQTAVTASVKKAVSAAAAEYSAAKEKAQGETEAKKLAAAEVQIENLTKIPAAAQGGGATDRSADSNATGTKAAPVDQKPVGIHYDFLYGSDSMSTFETIAPLLMGFFIFFFVFLLAGVAFLRERTSGTLERMLATPVRRFDIVLGYFLGFGIFIVIQTLLIQLFMLVCLHLVLKGSFTLVLVTNLLLASGSLSLGTLLSAFARNELQMFQFIPIVIVPQILFCGLFSLRGDPAWTGAVSRIFPLTYASDAIVNVAVRGLGFAAIAPDLAVLAAFTAVFLFLNALALKKYRRI